jgi:hypothetical protein
MFKKLIKKVVRKVVKSPVVAEVIAEAADDAIMAAADKKTGGLASQAEQLIKQRRRLH